MWLTLTGGAYRVSVRLAANVATPTGRTIPTSRRRATGHNAGERDAGKRRAKRYGVYPPCWLVGWSL
jgi:hypothetical protein